MRRLEANSTPLAFFCAKEGQGDTVVLGHALGADRHMWDQVVPLLPDGLRVIIWEQPGHGDSALLPQDSPDANDVAAAVAAGLEELGVGRAVVGGLSMGGVVTIALASGFPELVRSAAVMDAAPVLPPASMWFERARMVEEEGLGPQMEPAMERWFTAEFASGRGRELVESTEETFLSTGVSGYAQSCRIIGSTDLSEQFKQIEQAVLLLTGDGDEGTPPELMETLARQLKRGVGPVVVADSKHLPAVEQPQAVVDALVALLSQD